MIYVVLSRPRKFHISSWIIMRATGFDASHASVHWTGSGTFSGSRMVLESTAHGVGITHPSIWDRKNQPVHVYRLRSAHVDAGKQALGEMWHLLGADYDYKGLFHFAWRLILKRLFRIRTETADSPSELFCSELVARWLHALGRISGHRIIAMPPDATAPRDLAPIMMGMKVFEEAPCESLSSVTST